jgi:hypothetical protein
MTHRNLVKHSQMSEAVNGEEQIDNTRNDHEPDARRLPRNDSLRKVEGTTNPKNLASHKHYHDGEEEEVEKASVLIRVHNPECSVSKDQQKSDYSPVPDDSLRNQGESDHPRTARAP